MKSKPKVSVLMTCYNREKYISEAIESVLSSTYEDFELIIVDDCSQDRSVEIAKSYLEKDSRIKLHVNNPNKGQFQNRNYAASLAQGEYIKFLDSDDLMYPHCLEVMIRAMDAFPDAAVGLCKAYRGDFTYPHQYSSREALYEDLFKQRLLINAPNSSIYKKEAFLAIGGMPEDMGVSGDVWFLYKLVSHYSLVLMQTGLVFYRANHGEQVSNVQDADYVVSDRTKYLPGILMHEDMPLEENEKNRICNVIYGEAFRYFLRLMLKGKLTRGIQFSRKVGLRLAYIKYMFSRRKLV